MYLDKTIMLLAWCCLSQGYCKFMADRIVSATLADESFRPRRAPMLREYVAIMMANRPTESNIAKRERTT